MKKHYTLPMIECAQLNPDDILTESGFYQMNGQGDYIRLGDLISEDDQNINP